MMVMVAMGMIIMMKMMMIVIIVNDHNDNEYECEYEPCHLLLALFIVMQAPSIEVLKMIGSMSIAYTTYPPSKSGILHYG